MFLVAILSVLWIPTVNSRAVFSALYAVYHFELPHPRTACQTLLVLQYVNLEEDRRTIRSPALAPAV